MKTLWWVSLGVLIVGFLAMVYFVFVTRPSPADSLNCRLDGVVPAHTVVLIDQSDPFSKTDTEWTWNIIMDEARRLEKNGRLSVFAIETETPGDVSAIFTRCSPGSPLFANPLYENPAEIRRDWESNFQDQLEAVLAKEMLNSSYPLSPLIEQIGGILSRYDFSSTKPHRRLIIVSDMVQNSTSVSFYRSGASYEAFASTKLQVPDLKDVQVAVFFAKRDGGMNRSQLEQFWRKFFSDAGAASFEILR